MNGSKLVLILAIVTLTCTRSAGQINTTIDMLEQAYHACLDKGQNMLACSKVFYEQMDSLLNVQYKKMRLLCDSIQVENLRDEQVEWLAKRDEYFKKTLAEFKKKNPGVNPLGTAFGAKDDAMIMFDNNAVFVKSRVTELANNNPTFYSAATYKVNPTGFYSLDSKAKTKNGDTYGYFGDIKVKMLGNSKLVLRLFVCKGAPSYNSGTMGDTLRIVNNKAIYTAPDLDSSCKIIFTFFRQGIRVEEIADNYNSGCGFGHAVVANGFYKRKSYLVPTAKELTEE